MTRHHDTRPQAHRTAGLAVLMILVGIAIVGAVVIGTAVASSLGDIGACLDGQGC